MKENLKKIMHKKSLQNYDNKFVFIKKRLKKKVITFREKNGFVQKIKLKRVHFIICHLQQ